MTYAIPAPYTLTDADIAAVISAATIAGVYDPNGHLTDAGIAAAVSAATIGAKVGALAFGDVGSTVSCSYSASDISAGTNVAGSNLLTAGHACTGGTAGGQTWSGAWTGVTLSGTWVCTGRAVGNPGAQQGLSSFRRVA